MALQPERGAKQSLLYFLFLLLFRVNGDLSKWHASKVRANCHLEHCSNLIVSEFVF